MVKRWNMSVKPQQTTASRERKAMPDISLSDVGNTLQYMLGQNAAVMFIGSVRAAAKNPVQLREGLECFVAETLDKPEHELPARVRDGIHDAVKSQIASLTVAINATRAHRMKTLRNRVIWIVLAIVGLSSPRIQELVPEMWKPVVEALIEIVTD